MTFDEVKQMFQDSRIALGCSSKTLAWYKHMTSRYGEWLTKNNLTYDTVKLLHLQQYLSSLRTQYSVNTVKQTATAIITFYRWCMEIELIEQDPTVKLKRPKVPDKIQPVVARSYVEHLLASFEMYTWLDYRDKLIVQILFCTGLRISECTNLRVQDVDLVQRRFAIVGKGSKLRYQPFPPELVEPLREWLERWRPPIPNVEWLFFSATNRGMVRGAITAQAVRNAIRKRAEAAALSWVTLHGYRRGFAVDMLKHGASTRLVQKLLGHSNVATTELYLRLSPDDTQEMFDETWEELATDPAPEQPKAIEKPPANRFARRFEQIETPTERLQHEAGTTVTFTFWASDGGER